MEKKTFSINEKDVEEFREYLMERENSRATIEKYLRDVRKFMEYAGTDESLDKEKLLQYKEWMVCNYTVSSANSMLAALNQFLIFMEAGRLRLKRIRVQRLDVLRTERELSRKEFQKLVRTARQYGKEQTAMIMETMCATGIRVSELKFFRAENIRSGLIKVWNKGKYRIVILPEILRKKLILYIGKEKIRSGVIFRTRTGVTKDRSNIWKEMKKVAEKAGNGLKKVFPHNLGHLFARTFYRETKNLINLADILGHSSLEVTRMYAAEGLGEWRKNMEKIRLLEETT